MQTTGHIYTLENSTNFVNLSQAVQKHLMEVLEKRLALLQSQ